MTPRRDCGDEPVGQFDVGTRVTPPRAVTPRVALGARLEGAFGAIPFAFARDRQAFSRRLYRLS